MFTRPKRPSLSIDMAPLIDVVFLLLLFFMLTSSFSPPALPVQLPQARTGQPATSQPIVVSADASGKIAINGEAVELEAFDIRLREILEQNAGEAVSFHGDQQLDFGVFVDLMDRARKIGATQFNIVHQTRAE